MNPRSTDLYDAYIYLAEEKEDKKAESLNRATLQTGICLLMDVVELSREFEDLGEFTDCLVGIADALDDDSQEEYSNE